MSLKKDYKQVISDPDLTNKYMLLLGRRCDDIFELDLGADTYKLVAYVENKYFTPKISGRFSEMAAEAAKNKVYVHDREKFLKIFDLQYLTQYFAEKKEEIVFDFRLLSVDKSYRWVQAAIFALNGTDGNMAVCYVFDINDRKQREERESEYLDKKVEFSQRVFKSIGTVYSEVLEVDLETRRIISIKSNIMPQKEGGQFDYFKAFALFIERLIDEKSKKMMREEFSITALKSFIESGQKSRSIEVKYAMDDTAYEWIEVSVYAVSDEDLCHKRILITIRNINEQKLLRGIVDKFVYENCDYFIYLDAKNNSYVMFSASESGTPLPAVVCSDYGEEIVKYAEKYVAEADKKMVVTEMELQNVLEALDKNGEHNIYFGVIDPMLGYTRKRLQYRYYDKENKMILLTRTDVTSVYNAEKEKHDMLRRALEEARTDSLTGLYNQKAVRALVNERLKNREKGKFAACLFVDIDNFKQVNDSFGHQKGDELLQYVARLLRKMSFPAGLAGRVGGDEFVLFLGDLKDKSAVAGCAGCICSLFERLANQDLKKIKLSCSVGIALFPKDGENYNVLAQKADQALYYAKNKGKNQYAFYNEDVGNTSFLSMISSIDRRME